MEIATKIFVKTFIYLFFFWRSPKKFCEDLFFFWRALTLVSLILGLEHSCPLKGCPWPWPPDLFCVLGLGLEPCVLNSTSDLGFSVVCGQFVHGQLSWTIRTLLDLKGLVDGSKLLFE